MRVDALVARGYRNLADLEIEVPRGGFALLGRNGQGKTNLLEALYYPVLGRSLRGAADAEVARFGGQGFHVGVTLPEGPARSLAVTWPGPGRRKRIVADGTEAERLADVIGTWVAVAFLPSDVALAGGGAAGRRQYLDRMLSLADRSYLAALGRYRAALAQRNSALRQGRSDMAEAFDAPLAAAGATVVSARLAWAADAAPRFAAELEELGESGAGELTYRHSAELADAEAWFAALEAARGRDRARCMTTVGPHRDDLVLTVGGCELRAFGSTGQQRSAAIALKLLELDTLETALGRSPALLLDDVFAELDGGRQERLGRRLIEPDRRQVFLTAPRRDELPAQLTLPVWDVEAGRVTR